MNKHGQVSEVIVFNSAWTSLREILTELCLELLKILPASTMLIDCMDYSAERFGPWMNSCILRFEDKANIFLTQYGALKSHVITSYTSKSHMTTFLRFVRSDIFGRRKLVVRVKEHHSPISTSSAVGRWLTRVCFTGACHVPCSWWS